MANRKKYRLVNGSYVTSPKNEKGAFVKNEGGKKVEERYYARPKQGASEEAKKRFKNSKGDIVESDEDLAKKFPSKFERVQESRDYDTDPSTPPASTEDDDNGNKKSSDHRSTLEAMKVEDLKELAASEEIDLEGATKKSEIINRLLEAYES